MQALHEKMEKAKQAGDRKEIERLRTGSRSLARKVAGEKAAPRRPQAGGDIEARLQHLRAAAENLMAAGCQPEAQHVMQMIEQMRGARSGEGRSRDAEARTGQEPRRGDEARGRREPAGEQRRPRKAVASVPARERGQRRRRVASVPASERRTPEARRERTGERAPAAPEAPERTGEPAPACGARREARASERGNGGPP